MKRIDIILCFLVMNIFTYTPVCHGYSMAEYWAVKEGQVNVFGRELIVTGPETKTFELYTGREYLMASGYHDSQPFVHVGTAGVLFIGLYDKDSSSYIDLAGNPVVLSRAQMNLGETVSSTVPAGIFDPNTALVVTVTLEQLESVTVPAGTFNNCLKLKIYVQEGAGTYTEYIWLAKTIGPVQMYRESETNNTDGCFFTCGSIDLCTDQIGERYTKLKGYEKGGRGVVVIPLSH